MKKFLNLFLIVFSAKLTFSQAVEKTMRRLPDTGQTISYTLTFGEDADYTNNPPHYTLNGDGTVTDTVTGLMWQQADGGEMTIENAAIFCDTLSLGGYSDWRLPNCHELFSILIHGRVNPAIDTNYFTRSAAEYWWSNQRQINDSNKVWVTNAGGGVGNHLKTETLSAGGPKLFHVRAVRDVTQPELLNSHFIDNGNGTITDLLTRLIWQQQPLTDTISWEKALTYADTLSLSGSTDWRLPNIKELQSINDEKLIFPSVSQVYFSGISTGFYWSSTSLPNQTLKAWYLDTRYGITTYQFKTNKLNVLCVRGGDVSTRIEEDSYSKDNLIIYPIPTSGNFKVIYDKPIDHLTILNSIGSIVYELDPFSEKCEINLEIPGIYLISILSNNQFVTKRLIVE